MFGDVCVNKKGGLPPQCRKLQHCQQCVTTSDLVVDYILILNIG